MTAAAARAQRTVAVPVAVAAAGSVLAVMAGVAVVADGRVAVVVALGTLGAVLALRDLPLMLAVWCGLTVFSRHPDFGLATSAAGLLVLGSWLAQVRADSARVRAVLRVHRSLLIMLGLLLVWLTLSVAWARDPGAAEGELLAWYLNAGAVVVLTTSLQTARDLRLVLGAFVLAVLVAAALALAGVGLEPPQTADVIAAATEGRLVGVVGDPNFFAALIVPAVVLASVLRSTTRGSARLLLAAAVLVLLVALAATQSRGGLLAVVAAVLAAVVVMRGRRAAVLGAGAVGLLVVAVWFSANPGSLKRLQSAEQDRGNGRQDLWLVASRMSEQYPLTGVGLENFAVRSGEYVRRPGGLPYVDLVVDRPHVVHNTYLQMLAETGIVGLTLFMAVVGAAVSSARRAARRFQAAGERDLATLARGVLVADVGVLTAALFISAQATATVWVLLALGPAMLGLACARRHPIAPRSTARLD